MWVPRLIAIYPFEGGLPTGLIFASFMVCITIGGVIYSALGMDASVESYSFLCLLAAFGAMALCALGAPEAVMPQILPALGDFGPSSRRFWSWRAASAASTPARGPCVFVIFRRTSRRPS